MPIRDPETVWIVPTTKCNTRCVTCGHYYRNYGEDMSLDLFRRIEEQVVSRVRRVHLVGGGEPLVSSIFEDMMEACFARKVTVFFITNTIALDEKIARRLIANNAEIMISLDGATAPTYNSVRPFIKFDRLLAKLEMLRELRKEYPGNRFKLMTNTVMMRRNIHELPLIVELAERYKIDHLLFSALIPHEMQEGFSNEALDLHPELVAKYIPETIDKVRKAGIFFEMPSNYLQLAHAESRQAAASAGAPAGAPVYAPKERVFPLKCQMPWTHASISVKGMVSTCCITEHPLGDMTKQSFDEIWHGEEYGRVRRSVNTCNPPVWCKHCNLIAGITAGDSLFFPRFLDSNRLAVLPAAEVVATPGAASPSGAVEIHDGTSLRLHAPEAEFVGLRFAAAYDAEGGVRINGGEKTRLDFNDSQILIPLPAHAGTLDIELSLGARTAELREVSTYGYVHKARDCSARGSLSLPAGFDEHLAVIGGKLKTLSASSDAQRTAVVFGANNVGVALRDVVEASGLRFLGFIDNYVGFVDDTDVGMLEDLARMRPDVVVIASKAHAGEVAAQLKGVVPETTRLITGARV